MSEMNANADYFSQAPLPYVPIQLDEDNKLSKAIVWNIAPDAVNREDIITATDANLELKKLKEDLLSRLNKDP
jgi:hypothetical protein